MGARRAIVDRGRQELVHRTARSRDTADLFAQASGRLRKLVPFDAAAWMATDPATGFPVGPTRIENLDDLSAAECSEYWRREFVDPDVITYQRLARAERPVSALQLVTGDPVASARYRSSVRRWGFDDELRAVLRDGDSPWGAVTLWRRPGRQPFSEEDIELVASLTAPLGRMLRRHARPHEALVGGPSDDRPGILVFSAADELRSVDDQARAWLAELPSDQALSTDLGVDIPVWLMIAVFHARSVQESGDGWARIRVRSRRGAWVVCHASSVRDRDGSIGEIVVVIERAAPAEVAPIIIDAFDLSDREQQVIRLIARGAGTREIADELFLSPNTVRDHVKTIFSKAGVTSRGELVAKLFAEFYEPVHMHGVSRFQVD